MEIASLAGLAIVSVLLAVAGLVAIGGFTTARQARQSARVSTLLVKVPTMAATVSNVFFKSVIGLFSHSRIRGWNKLILGEPHLAVQIPALQSQGMTGFYLNFPAGEELSIREILTVHFPSAQIAKVENVSLINFEDASATDSFHYTADAAHIRLNPVFDNLNQIRTVVAGLNHQTEQGLMTFSVKPKSGEGDNRLFEIEVKLAAWAASAFRARELLARFRRQLSA